jgi:argininosuccinate synthase
MTAAGTATGDIRLRVHGGRAVVIGQRSPASLYDDDLAPYDTGDTFGQALSKGCSAGRLSLVRRSEPARRPGAGPRAQLASRREGL